MKSERYENQMTLYRDAVEEYLATLFADKPPYAALFDSMRYSLLAGGKRIRPILALEFARLGGVDWHSALPYAAAVEMVHTYSLIHDDLPCMDDDDLRRGKPTNHIVYGETMAVLAGDALQAEAFVSIAGASCSDASRARAAAILARACGARGMVAGQVLDIAGASDEQSLTQLHALKTGALICGAAELGCAAAEADESLFAAAREYAAQIGLAFQIRDDVLDVTANEELLGKPVGSDREEGKTTFVDLFGVDGCRARILACTEAAKRALDGIDGADFLCELADRLATREM